MNRKRTLFPGHSVAMIIAATLSFVMSAGVLTAVAQLFLHEGMPFQRSATAGHACRDSASESGRCARDGNV